MGGLGFEAGLEDLGLVWGVRSGMVQKVPGGRVMGGTLAKTTTSLCGSKRLS